MDIMIENFTRAYLFGLVTVADSAETLIMCANVLVQGKFKECEYVDTADETFQEYSIAGQILKNKFCNDEVLKILATSSYDTVRHTITEAALPQEVIDKLIYDESFYVVHGLFESGKCFVTEENLKKLAVRLANINSEELQKQNKELADEFETLLYYLIEHVDLSPEVLEILASSNDASTREAITNTYLPLELVSKMIYDESFRVVSSLLESKEVCITQANINDLVVRLTNIDIEEVKKQKKNGVDYFADIVQDLLSDFELPEESKLALEEIAKQL